MLNILRYVLLFLCAGLILAFSGHDPQDRTWVSLEGPWVLTTYGYESDGFLGQRHGAAWNSLQCNSYYKPWLTLPDLVGPHHMALATPSAAFYCRPLKVCYQGKCVVGVAVDVPRDGRICKGQGDCYNHLDLWPLMYKELGEVFAFDSIFYSDQIEVFIGPVPEQRGKYPNVR